MEYLHRGFLFLRVVSYYIHDNKAHPHYLDVFLSFSSDYIEFNPTA